MFRINRYVVAPLVAEFIATFFLVMVALVLGQTTAVSYFIATSVAIAAAVVYLVFSHISGAHANPAITFGMWTARRIGTLRGVTYVAAQLIGALLAWQLFQYLTGHIMPARNVPFTTQIWLGEVVGTALLAMAYAAVMTRKFEGLYSGVMIGAAYFVGIVVAAIASVAYINPAIALGSRAWSGAYVLGPLVGGLIGVNLYTYLLAPASAAVGGRSSGGVVVKRTSVRSLRRSRK